MARLNTPWRTWFPDARWSKLWRSPKGDGATASAAPRPVGYLVNHPTGLSGFHGIGYDYVVGSGGLYVQSQSAQLVARVLVAPCAVRGLAPVAEKIALPHGPIPAYLFELGLRWFQEAPYTERFLRSALGRRRLPAGGPRTGWDLLVPHLPTPCGCGGRVPLPREGTLILLRHRRPR